MSIDKNHLRSLISDVLKTVNLYSESAVELLMLTAAVESNLGSYLVQQKGPAQGIFQMEPATRRDIFTRFSKNRKELMAVCKRYFPVNEEDHDIFARGSIPFQIVMTRIYYLEKPGSIPNANDVAGLAEYWKKHYNTYLGKGTVEKAVAKYNRYCV